MIRALRRHKDPMASPPYLSLFKLREAPFSSQGGGKFFYPDPERAQTLNMLQHLTQYSEELLLVSGPAGSGKTSLLEQYLARADDDWKVCQVSGADSADPGVLFLTAARCFGLHTEGLTSENLLDALREHLNQLQQSMTPVLVVDAAERLSDDALEVVVRLAELPGEHGKLVRTILFAEPEIQQRLAAERFASAPKPHVLQLKPLDEGQLTSYLHHRLSAAGYVGGALFSPRELKRIYKSAHGWPGGINASAHEVLMDKLQAARPSRWRALTVVGIVAGLALGAYLALFTGVGGRREAAPAERSAVVKAVPEQPIVRNVAQGGPVHKALVVRGGETLQITCAAPALQQPVVVAMPEPLSAETPTVPAPAEQVAMPAVSPGQAEHSATTATVPEPGAEAGPAPAEHVPTAEATMPPAETPEQAPVAAPEGAPTEAEPAPSTEEVARTDQPATPAEPEPTVAAPAKAEVAETEGTETIPVAESGAAQEEAPPAASVTEPVAPKAEPVPEVPLPVVTRVEPSPVPGSRERQRVIVYGENFVPESKVTVSWRGGRKTLGAGQTEFLDDKRIAIEITTGVQADTWSVAVTAADGRVSASRRFQVSAPARAAVAPAKPATPPQAATKSVAGYRDSAWLWTQDPGHFTVQLVAASTEEAVRNHLQGYNINGDVALLVTKRAGKPWYVVFWGDFSDRAAADKAVAGLPAPLRRVEPWVRSFADVRREMNVGGIAVR